MSWSNQIKVLNSAHIVLFSSVNSNIWKIFKWSEHSNPQRSVSDVETCQLKVRRKSSESLQKEEFGGSKCAFDVVTSWFKLPNDVTQNKSVYWTKRQRIRNVLSKNNSSINETCKIFSNLKFMILWNLFSSLECLILSFAFWTEI